MTPAHRSNTLAALAVAATPPGRRQPGLTVASGTVPAVPVEVATAPRAAAAQAINWDAIAAEQNAKTETEAARAGRRVAYGRSL